MEKMELRIEVLEPLVLSGKNGDAGFTASREVFSGTAIRGALAARYIKRLDLGRKAHEDEGFRSLFLADDVRFLAAYPALRDRQSMVLPLSLQKAKIGGEIIDLAFDEPKAGCKAMKGFACIDGNVLETAAGVKKSVSLHMDRSSDGERLAGKSEEGKIYTYESVLAGQTFIGEIVGPAEKLHELAEALAVNEEPFYFGRSKYTQYGKCRVLLGDVEKLPPVEPSEGTLCLYCKTPFLAERGSGRADQAFQECVDFLNSETGTRDFELVSDCIFSGGEEVENFVSIWGMRRPNELAISAGSVFKIRRTAPWTSEAKDALQRLLYGGVGLRPAEGFGQFRLWEKHGKLMNKAEEESLERQNIAIPSDVKKLAQNIIWRYIRRKIREAAFDDVNRLRRGNVRSRHLFSRLENMLGDRKEIAGVKRRFERKVREEIPETKIAGTHLQKMRLNGKHLLELLRGEAEPPYTGFLKKSAILDESLQELMHEVDFQLPDETSDELFYEYWLWFFRHVRKTVGKGDEGNE